MNDITENNVRKLVKLVKTHNYIEKINLSFENIKTKDKLIFNILKDYNREEENSINIEFSYEDSIPDIFRPEKRSKDDRVNLNFDFKFYLSEKIDKIVDFYDLIDPFDYIKEYKEEFIMKFSIISKHSTLTKELLLIIEDLFKIKSENLTLINITTLNDKENRYLFNLVNRNLNFKKGIFIENDKYFECFVLDLTSFISNYIRNRDIEFNTKMDNELGNYVSNKEFLELNPSLKDKLNRMVFNHYMTDPEKYKKELEDSKFDYLKK